MSACAPTLVERLSNSKRRVTEPVLLSRVALALSVFLLTGCPDRPELVSARFVDENRNGQADPEETIIFTFSRPVRLDAAPARRGVRVLPEGHSLGVYELEGGANEYQLALRLGQGHLEIEADGFFGVASSPNATGLFLDYGKLGALYDDEGGSLMRGISAPVDLARNPHPPARLEGAIWIDEDRNQSISRGDHIRFQFDRHVTISEAVQKKNGRIPKDLFILPVAGDTLDGGDDSAHLILHDGEIVVVLGERPQLTPFGTFDPRFANLAGYSSGIAIDGTSIRPHPAIVDDFGVGVTSHRPLDIEAESLKPFLPAPSFLAAGETLSGHTATALPSGKILLTGGMVTARQRGLFPAPGSNPSRAVWIFDPDTGEWEQVGNLKFPRWGHTATYLPGTDLTYETPDDFVFIVGGCDGTKAIPHAEIILALPTVDGEYVIEPWFDYSQKRKGRYEHSAHRVGNSNRVILIGGQVDLQRNLEPRVEELRVTVPPGTPGQGEPQVEVRQLNPLETPRVSHQAILYPPDDPQVIFVFGGLGQEAGRGNVSAFFGRALEAPELVWIHEKADPPKLTVENAHSSPGQRRGHRMVVLMEEEWPILIVGGTSAPLLESPRPDHCDGAYRATLDLVSNPQNPRIRFRRAGTLTHHVYDFGAQPLPTGKVLILGGAEGDAPSQHVQLFNPRTDHFETFCQPLLAPRENPRIVPLASGNRWLITGGRGAEEAPDRPSIEEFVWLE